MPRMTFSELLAKAPDRPIRRRGIALPDWMRSIDPDITATDVEGIALHGCAAMAHSACFYSQALRVMDSHGDDVLSYLEDRDVEIPTAGLGWGGMASAYLSAAVELYCTDLMAGG